jgi:hypothetical protein
MRIAKLTFALLAASLGIGALGTTALGAETGPWQCNDRRKGH